MISPVGSGKTALLLALCRALRDEYNIGTSPLLPLHIIYILSYSEPVTYEVVVC